jgi:hypothetical protein
VLKRAEFGSSVVMLSRPISRRKDYMISIDSVKKLHNVFIKVIFNYSKISFRFIYFSLGRLATSKSALMETTRGTLRIVFKPLLQRKCGDAGVHDPRLRTHGTTHTNHT